MNTITQTQVVVKQATMSQRDFITKLLIKTAQKYELAVSKYELKSCGADDYFWKLITSNLKLIPISLDNQFTLKNQREWNISVYEASSLIQDLININNAK